MGQINILLLCFTVYNSSLDGLQKVIAWETGKYIHNNNRSYDGVEEMDSEGVFCGIGVSN